MEKHIHEHACTHCGCNDPFGKDLLNAIFIELDVSTQTHYMPRDTPHNAVDRPFIISANRGGTIRPVTQGNADITVEAIGIAHDKIIAVGTLEYVKTYVESKFGKHAFDYKYIEKGQTLLPGLIEPHVHTCGDAIITNFISLSGINNQMIRVKYDLDYIKTPLNNGIQVLKKRRIIPDNINENTWILGKDIDPAFMPFPDKQIGMTQQLTTLDLATLDKLHASSPLALLSASAHTLYINTRATENIWHFWKKYPDLEPADKPKSNIGKWLTSTRPGVYQSIKIHLGDTPKQFSERFDGQLQEMDQMLWAICAIPENLLTKYMSKKSVTGSIEKLLDEAASKGITFLYDASFTQKQRELLIAIMQDKHPVRIGGALACANIEQIDNARTKENIMEYENAYVGHIKLVSDGSNQGLTGYQYQSYDCYPPMPEGGDKIQYKEKSQGVANFAMLPNGKKPFYPDLVRTAVNNEWPLMIHANGDNAIDNTIDVYKNAYTRYIGNVSDWINMRHRIEHCSLLNPARIDIMKKYALSPSFLIGHVGYWGYAFDHVIFKEKARHLDLCQSSIASGLRITLHSDFPVSPIGPLRLMEQSMTRVTEASPEIKNYTEKFNSDKKSKLDTAPLDDKILDANTLNLNERLSGSEALGAATYNAAWQCHADRWVGSLEVGKFADFVILKIDPVTMKNPFLKMRDIDNVLETWKGGEKVFPSASSTEKAVETDVDVLACMSPA